VNSEETDKPVKRRKTKPRHGIHGVAAKYTPPEREAIRNSLTLWHAARAPDYQSPYFHHGIVIPRIEKLFRREGKRKLMLVEPPGHGKPVHDQGKMLMHDGTRLEAHQVRVGDRVITHAGRSCEVSAVHVQGVLPCLRISTATGRETVVAFDHPFLTPGGWVKASALRPGMVLANVPTPRIGGSTIRDEAFRLAGYFIGDGCTRYTNAGAPNVSASITCLDAVQREDIRNCAMALGYGVGRETEKNIPIIGGVRDWIREIGIAGHGSRTKRVPGFVFQGSAEQVGHFIGAYFACDGSINRRGNVRVDACVEIYSINRDLLADVQHLLLRVGVQSRLKLKRASSNNFTNGPIVSWRLGITSQDDVAKFVERVPLHSVKKQTLLDWGVARQRFDSQLLPDKIEAIEPAGELPCRCFTVENDHTFTVDDLVVHNSQISTVSGVPFYLGNHPGHSAMTLSYGDDRAREFGSDVKDVCQSTLGREIFPGLELTKDSKSIKFFKTDQGNRYYSYSFASIGGGVHLDFLGIDDPVKGMNEAESESYMERTIKSYTSVVRNRMKPGGIILANLTRFSLRDWAARVLEAEGNEWDVLTIPAENENGEYLWEEYKGRDFYENAKRDTDTWWAVFQGQPKAFESHWFREEDFLYYDQKELDPKWARYMICDPASSTHRRADRTSILVVVAGPERRVFVVDWIYDRLDPGQRADAIVQLLRKWKPRRFTYEQVGLTNDTWYLNERLAKEQMLHMRPTPVGKVGQRAHMSKEARIEELKEDLFNHRIYFPYKLEKTLAGGEKIDVIQTFKQEEYLPYRGKDSVPRDDGLDTLSRLHDPELRLDFIKPSLPGHRLRNRVLSWELTYG